MAKGFVGGGTYKVKAGDNLWKIAEEVYGDGKFIKTLANKLGTTVIRPGMVIKLPVRRKGFTPVITNADLAEGGSLAGSGLGQQRPDGSYVGGLAEAAGAIEPVKREQKNPSVEELRRRRETMAQFDIMNNFDQGSELPQIDGGLQQTAFMQSGGENIRRVSNRSLRNQERVLALRERDKAVSTRRFGPSFQAGGQQNTLGQQQISPMQHGSVWQGGGQSNVKGLWGQQMGDQYSEGGDVTPTNYSQTGMPGRRLRPEGTKTPSMAPTGPSSSLDPDNPSFQAYMNWIAEGYARAPGVKGGEGFDAYVSLYAQSYIDNVNRVMDSFTGTNTGLHINADGEVVGSSEKSVQLTHVPAIIQQSKNFPLTAEQMAEVGFELNDTGSVWMWNPNYNGDAQASNFASTVSGTPEIGRSNYYGGYGGGGGGGGGGGYSSNGGGQYVPRLGGLVLWRGVGFG